ncbi:MAG: polysaccharide biosynthesis tyrosine autokinase [Verrucomicrobiota bacterium]
MPPLHRSSRQISDSDDAADDVMETDAANGAGQDKMRRLILSMIGRWHWIVLGGILGLLGASYYLAKSPKQYTATATLLIKQQTASVMARDQVEEIDMRSAEAMNTVAERIRRMDLLERVASRQDVRELPGLMPIDVDWMPDWLRNKLGKKSADAAHQAPPPPAALGAMASQWLSVSIRRNTRLLDISITHPVPEAAKALADAVAREYLAEIANARTAGRSNSIDLLEKESKEARNNIQASRSALSIYARTLEVHKTLDTKESELAALQRRYLPKHPKMITASAELQQLKEQFIREFEDARQAASDKPYWDVAGKELPERQAHPEEYLHAARQLLLARIGVLESETQSATSVFNSMLTRIKETSVNQESEESSAEVSNLARVPGMPTAPVPNKVLAGGTVGGFAGGILLVLLLLRLDNRYHTVSQVAAETHVTVLGAIADIKINHLEVAEQMYRKRNPDSHLESPKGWDKRLVFRPGASTTSYAEMYRVMRASITLLGDEMKRKITLFTSSLPGEGKTLTSTNFAIAAAGQGRKTLLIDMDLRKPSVHRFFGLPRAMEHGGLTECLANITPFEEVICRDTGQPNLHLILAGKTAPNPGELLETGRLHELLEQACREYDVVVLDTAPILAVPDTRIIAPLADNICLVARAEHSPKGAVRRTLQILAEDGTTLSGIIFNGFVERRRLMGENYSYGYYKTSRYGRAYRYGYGGAYGAYGSDSEKKSRRK